MPSQNRELTGQEKQRIKKLITSLCANYDKEYGCLPLSGSPQNNKFCGERRNSGMNELRSYQTEASGMELVTTSNCPMFGICYTNSALCRYFRSAVLPTDVILQAVFRGGYSEVCGDYRTDAHDCQRVCEEDYRPCAGQVQRPPAAENPDYLELRRGTETGRGQADH